MTLPSRRSVDTMNVPWVDSPVFEQLLERSDLDERARTQARDFARDGYLVIDPGLPDFDALADEIVRECNRRPEYADRIQDGWEHTEAIRRVAVAPAVLDLLRVLYRREPIPMQTLNFGRGTEQRAHSDTFHFNCIPHGFMCGVWVALEDIDEDNGPLEYYPGSHKLPEIDFQHMGITASDQKDYEYYALYEDFLQELIAELALERRVLTMKRGQALLWAANLLHGGQPIRDAARTRHSQVTHYYFEDCLYYQPQRSDPFLGKIFWLDKRDVRTGELIPQMHNGRPVEHLGLARKLARKSGIASWLRRRSSSSR